MLARRGARPHARQPRPQLVVPEHGDQRLARAPRDRPAPRARAVAQRPRAAPRPRRPTTGVPSAIASSRRARSPPGPCPRSSGTLGIATTSAAADQLARVVAVAGGARRRSSPSSLDPLAHAAARSSGCVGSSPPMKATACPARRASTAARAPSSSSWPLTGWSRPTSATTAAPPPRARSRSRRARLAVDGQTGGSRCGRRAPCARASPRRAATTALTTPTTSGSARATRRASRPSKLKSCLTQRTGSRVPTVASAETSAALTPFACTTGGSLAQQRPAEPSARPERSPAAPRRHDVDGSPARPAARRTARPGARSRPAIHSGPSSPSSSSR